MPDRRLTLTVIAASFVLVGVMTTLTGVLLPFLSRQYAMPPATTAWMFPAQFCCGATVVVSSGIVLRRFGFRVAWVWGTRYSPPARRYSRWLLGPPSSPASACTASGLGRSIRPPTWRWEHSAAAGL
jgi:hypothetical protein